MHTLAQAEAALRAGQARGLNITLRSAPGAAHYAGLGFMKALFESAAGTNPRAKHSVILDCGADAALAHRAMVMGFHRIAFSGPRAMRNKIAQIGRKCRAEMAAPRAPSHSLDLLDSHHPEDCAGAYLDRRRAPKRGTSRHGD